MKLTKYKVMRIIVFFVCLTCLLSFTQRCLKHTRNSEMELLDDGWNITINEKNYENSEISHFKVPVLEKNDIVTLTKNPALSRHRFVFIQDIPPCRSGWMKNCFMSPSRTNIRRARCLETVIIGSHSPKNMRERH